jgi:hypothetical protein
MPFEVDVVEGARTLWVDSSRIEACMKYYYAEGIEYLGINQMRAYALGDIEFLRSYPDVTGLMLVAPSGFRYDIGPVGALRQLKSLVLPTPEPLALAQFVDLQEFIGVWHPKLDLVGCNSLKHLRLREFKSKNADLSGFPALPSLRDLGIVQSSLASLKGISQFGALRRLELAYLTKLETLDGIDGVRSLERLECEKCRKLKRHEMVQQLKHLRVLRFFDCGVISNLKFIAQMPALEEFRFVKTEISDGDLTPLLRLKSVGFLAKKGYSHSPEQMDAILRPRGGSAVVRDDDPAPVPWKA